MGATMSQAVAPGNIVVPARQSQVIDREINQRIQLHQAHVAAMSTLAAASTSRPLNLLGAGDSWFDYPLPLGSPSDILAVLSERALVLKLAHHGDATTDLLGVDKRARLVEALSDPRNGVFDAMLFSGGGNDLVGNQFRLWLSDAPPAPDPADAINQPAFDNILGVVKTAYLDLIAARNSVAAAHSIPILVHAYDFALPTDNGVCGVGPWLFPSLRSRGWMTAHSAPDLDRGAAIVKLMLGQFHAFLQALADDPNNNLVLIPTQGTLRAADWDNELHPNPGGFRKIAALFADTLDSLFPGRLMQPMQMRVAVDGGVSVAG